MADKSFGAEKRAWLDMGESWALLIICSEGLPFEENFNARVSPKPTVAGIWQWLHEHFQRVEWLISFSPSFVSSLAADRRPGSLS